MLAEQRRLVQSARAEVSRATLQATRREQIRERRDSENRFWRAVRRVRLFFAIGRGTCMTQKPRCSFQRGWDGSLRFRWVPQQGGKSCTHQVFFDEKQSTVFDNGLDVEGEERRELKLLLRFWLKKLEGWW